MKKIILSIGIGLVVLAVLAVLAISFFLDGAVKRGVETVGPKLTLVPVKLDNVSLSVLSGSGKLTGFVLGNPEGFKAPHALSVNSASLALKPGSLLSDKLVIHKLELIAPEITFEGGLGGNNLSKIQANLEKTTGGTGSDTNTAPAESESKKLQVDEFLISGAKVHVNITDAGGYSQTVPIPDIHLSNLGTGPEGITPGELAKRVLAAIEKEALKVAMSKGVDRLTKELDKAAGEQGGKLGKSLGDLLKKK